MALRTPQQWQKQQRCGSSDDTTELQRSSERPGPAEPQGKVVEPAGQGRAAHRERQKCRLQSRESVHMQQQAKQERVLQDVPEKERPAALKDLQGRFMTEELLRSPSLAALASSLAEAASGDLNAIHVAAAYRRLAQLQKGRQRALLSPYEVHRLASLHATLDGLALQHVASMRPRELSGVLWAAASVGHALPTLLLGNLMEEMLRHFRACNEIDVSNVVWALVTHLRVAHPAGQQDPLVSQQDLQHGQVPGVRHMASAGPMGGYVDLSFSPTSTDGPSATAAAPLLPPPPLAPAAPAAPAPASAPAAAAAPAGAAAAAEGTAAAGVHCPPARASPSASPSPHSSSPSTPPGDPPPQVPAAAGGVHAGECASAGSSGDVHGPAASRRPPPPPTTTTPTPPPTTTPLAALWSSVCQGPPQEVFQGQGSTHHTRPEQAAGSVQHTGLGAGAWGASFTSCFNSSSDGGGGGGGGGFDTHEQATSSSRPAASAHLLPGLPFPRSRAGAAAAALQRPQHKPPSSGPVLSVGGAAAGQLAPPSSFSSSLAPTARLPSAAAAAAAAPASSAAAAPWQATPTALPHTPLASTAGASSPQAAPRAAAHFTLYPPSPPSALPPSPHPLPPPLPPPTSPSTPQPARSASSAPPTYAPAQSGTLPASTTAVAAAAAAAAGTQAPAVVRLGPAPVQEPLPAAAPPHPAWLPVLVARVLCMLPTLSERSLVVICHSLVKIPGALSPAQAHIVVGHLFHRMRAFGAQDLANMLCSMARLGVRPQEAQMQELAVLVHNQLRGFKGDEIALVLHSFAKLRYLPTRSLLQGMCRTTSGQLSKCCVGHIALMVWSFSQLRWRPPPAWLELAVAEVCERAHELHAQELATLMYGLGAFKHRPDQPEMTVLLDRMLLLINQGGVSPWQLTSYITCLVRLHQRVLPPFQKAALRACYLALPKFSNLGLGYMLWGVARLAVWRDDSRKRKRLSRLLWDVPPDWLAAVGKQVSSRLPTLCPVSAPLILWALAKLHSCMHRPSPGWLGQFWQAAVRLLPLMQPRGVVAMLQASVWLRYTPQASIMQEVQFFLHIHDCHLPSGMHAHSRMLIHRMCKLRAQKHWAFKMRARGLAPPYTLLSVLRKEKRLLKAAAKHDHQALRQQVLGARRERRRALRARHAVQQLQPPPPQQQQQQQQQEVAQQQQQVVQQQQQQQQQQQARAWRGRTKPQEVRLLGTLSVARQQELLREAHAALGDLAAQVTRHLQRDAEQLAQLEAARVRAGLAPGGRLRGVAPLGMQHAAEARGRQRWRKDAAPGAAAAAAGVPREAAAGVPGEAATPEAWLQQQQQQQHGAAVGQARASSAQAPLRVLPQGPSASASRQGALPGPLAAAAGGAAAAQPWARRCAGAPALLPPQSRPGGAQAMGPVEPRPRRQQRHSFGQLQPAPAPVCSARAASASRGQQTAGQSQMAPQQQTAGQQQIVGQQQAARQQQQQQQQQQPSAQLRRVGRGHLQHHLLQRRRWQQQEQPLLLRQVSASLGEVASLLGMIQQQQRRRRQQQQQVEIEEGTLCRATASLRTALAALQRCEPHAQKDEQATLDTLSELVPRLRGVMGLLPAVQAAPGDQLERGDQQQEHAHQQECMRPALPCMPHTSAARAGALS